MMAINLDFAGDAATRVVLERPKSVGYKQFPWVSCAPFVDNLARNFDSQATQCVDIQPAQ